MSVKSLLLMCSVTVAAVLSIACEGETVVTKVDSANAHAQKGNGVLFSLPETMVTTEVPVAKVTSSPGVFHKWTEFFYPDLTADDYTIEEKTVFKLGTPTFGTRGRTDPNNVYLAHIKAKAFETKTLLLEFNEDGIVARTEASSRDETIDIITSAIKTGASFAAPLLHVGSGAAAADVKHEIEEDCRKKEEAWRNAPAAAKAEPFAAAAKCFEDHFKKQLTPRELALYESLEGAYKTFLLENFGYNFLTYLAKKEDIGGTIRSANISFFFTLNKNQQDFIKNLPRSSSACDWATTGSCLANTAKAELVRARSAFDKIQDLRQKREAFLEEITPAQVNSSTNLEFRLKELDAKINEMEQSYFLGTSSETSAMARFEFKPTTGNPNQTLFTYAAGGSKPGICEGGVSAETNDFKTTWPQKLGGAVCKTPGNYQFELGDFRDLKKLVAALNPPGGGAARDPLSAYIYAQLAGVTQAWLASPFTTPQAKNRLLLALKNDLNQVLAGPSLNTLVNFDQFKLSPATLELLAIAAPTPAQLVQLNRYLIEDVYRAEIYRQESWVSHKVTLEVDLPAPGLSSTVGNAINQGKLTESGKRSFPYRVAPSTLARVMDDGKEKSRSGVRIAQFGPVRTLPASLGGRRSSYKLTYYDSSGAIKIFDMSSDALIQKQNVTDLTDAATTLRDAEAARLQRQTDLLKAKKDKLEAEKALIEAEKELKEAQGEPSPTPLPR